MSRSPFPAFLGVRVLSREFVFSSQSSPNPYPWCRLVCKPASLAPNPASSLAPRPPFSHPFSQTHPLLFTSHWFLFWSSTQLYHCWCEIWSPCTWPFSTASVDTADSSRPLGLAMHRALLGMVELTLQCPLYLVCQFLFPCLIQPSNWEIWLALLFT